MPASKNRAYQSGSEEMLVLLCISRTFGALLEPEKFAIFKDSDAGFLLFEGACLRIERTPQALEASSEGLKSAPNALLGARKR